MRTTPFPERPRDVATLTASEFASGLDLHVTASIDTVCQRFLDDANRALVWFIRFRALTAWCGRAEIATWLTSAPSRARYACELAARFELNDCWEFDVEPFRSAVASEIVMDTRTPAERPPHSERRSDRRTEDAPATRPNNEVPANRQDDPRRRDQDNEQERRDRRGS
jgi:hypothetical protein